MKDIRSIFCAAGIVLITGFIFLPSLQNGFTTLDDDVLVTENTLIRTVSPGSVQKMFSAPFQGLYHPLVLLSYALEYRFFGLTPRAYHATNLGLHVANALLVFWFFFLLSGSRRAAALAALLFAVHPLHVESVAWISGRKDLLYALFFLGSAVAFLAWRKFGSARYYLLSLVLFLSSLLSKSMAMTLPAVLVLSDMYRGRKPTGKTWRETLPFWGLSLVFGLVSVLVHYGPPNGSTIPSASTPGIAGACNAFVFYLVKTAVPLNLSCYYPYSGSSWSGFYPFAAAGMLVTAVITATAAMLSRRWRSVGFGTALFAVMLLPVLQVVPVGQGVPADRYTYLPSIGLFFIFGNIFAAMLRRGKIAGYAASVVAVTAVLALSGLSAKRCAVWKDGVTLWSDVIARFPDDPRAYRCRGDAYKGAGNYAAAFNDYDRAIALKPDYAAAYNNRGNAFSAMRDPGRAIADYSRALALQPGYTNARYNRGVAYAERGEFDRALEDYGVLLENDPRNADVRNNRGVVYAKLRRYPQAIEDFSAAIFLGPGMGEARANRAAAYFAIGDYPGAAYDISWLEQNGITVNAGLDQAIASAIAAGKMDKSVRK